MKYIFDQSLIERLRKGEIVIDYGNSQMPDKLEKLRAVLKEGLGVIFKANGVSKFYNKSPEGGWYGMHELSTADTPILLDYFIYEPGDEVYHVDSGCKYLFIGMTRNQRLVLEIESSGGVWVSDWKNITKTPPTTTMTKQQVADKFGVKLDTLVITDGEKSI